MNDRRSGDRKTVLYAIALCALVLTFASFLAPLGHVDHRTEYSEIASNVWARIVLTSLFTMSFLSAPPNFVFYGIAVLGIVQYNNRRIKRKIERSYVPTSDPRYQRLLDDVAGEAGVKDVEMLVLDSSFPNAFTLNRGPKYYVAITVSMLEILEAEELRSALAHEIAHIKNKDSRIKILGLVVCSQYFYQPFVYLIVKAIFRRREYLADETAAALEQTSLPLMSALLKIAQYLRSFSGSEDIPFPTSSFAFAQRPSTGLRRILSSAPTIEDRIRNLIELRT